MDMQWFLDRDAFAKSLGIRLIEVAPGYARTAMDITANHRNGAGIAHGGAIFTLADLAFAVAANSHGKLSLGVAASIAYIKAGLGSTLFAEAREISLGSKLATYVVTISNDNDEVIASMQGTVYRKDVPYTRETA
ncbi:hotdog fold thioesterase [Desulfovibrio aerotolerans]|uniref:Hotdog fold thioesterase n=1 Tax=Solidesulfovibrio aerotolerans TaxID=295255 RepID=A0A7C9IRC9_9BACT|nr:hotdog fold thioesterase [Solidesulfovibrio aerotolerans]MYL82007.1 hotdog fold thioesterase [Solidesulfovibrio aerotolerans]